MYVYIGTIKINHESSDMESTNIFIFDALDPLFFSNSVQKGRGTCS